MTMQEETINLEDYTKSDWAIMLNDRIITRFTTHEGNKLIIGRSPDADVVIDNTAISRHHSSIELRDGRHYLADMQSTNGTFVNGKRIASKVPISDNDFILIGKFRLIQAAANEQHAPSSYATAMNIDDEATIFVSSPRQQAAAKATMEARPSAKELYRLSVIEGHAKPMAISLDGKSSMKIGKDPSCDMVISGWFVGKTQCYVVSKKDKYYLVPQRSWANTRLNGVSIKEERLLRKDDIIQIKSVKIRFS